jgi:hypothetical protein
MQIFSNLIGSIRSLYSLKGNFKTSAKISASICPQGQHKSFFFSEQVELKN